LIKQIRILSHSYKSLLNLLLNYLIINTFLDFGVRVSVTVSVSARVRVSVIVRVRVSVRVGARVRA
jgi:hypothetical protein